MDKILQSFKMAIKNILGNKGRSALTMLGIVIGVASVIILTGLGSGATASINESISEIGTKLITVSVTRGFGGTRRISVDDMQDFLEKYPDLVENMSPMVSSKVTAKVGTNNTMTSLSGVDSTYAQIRESDGKLTAGRYFSESDVKNRKAFCIIGSYLANEFFGGDAVGQTIKLNGRQFTVIGVYKESGDSTENSADNKISIPYTTAVRFLKSNNISQFYFAATTEDTVEMAVNVLKNYIQNKLGSENGFTVSSVAEMLDTLDSVMGTLTTMLAGIAAISLVVGGIGIMNIMTVTVSERTREIGIRKAIGARTTDILLQFLIESAILSAMGGVVGIIFGGAVAFIVGKMISITAVIEPSMVALGFNFSLAIGIIFGIAPAKRAAKMHPIEALRSE